MSALWALAVSVFAVGVDTYILVSVLPEIADSLGEPIGAVGLLASAYALPTALLAPIFGPFSDRHGRQAAMTLGLLVFIGSAAACIVAPSLPLLLVARAVNGLGAAIIVPAAFAYAGDLRDEKSRDRAMGVLAAAFPLATLLGLPFGTLATVVAGWRGAFVFVAFIGVLALVLVRLLCKDDRARTDAPLGYIASYGRILGDRSALLLLSVTFVWFIGPMGLFVYIAEFIHVTHAVPSAQAGLALLMVGLVGVAASRLSGRSMAVLGPRTAVLGAITLFGTAMLLMPLTTSSLVLSLLALGLWAAGTWFGVPAMQAIVAGHSDRLRGTMLAFNSSALNLAGVVGPILIGAVISGAGFGAAFLTGSLLAVATFALAWVVLPRRQATEPVTAAGA